MANQSCWLRIAAFVTPIAIAHHDIKVCQGGSEMSSEPMVEFKGTMFLQGKKVQKE